MARKERELTEVVLKEQLTYHMAKRFLKNNDKMQQNNLSVLSITEEDEDNKT